MSNFLEKIRESREGRDYLALIDVATNRQVVEGSVEKHHIVPIALGGSNENTNLVKLTVFEHCLAHTLLAKAYPCYKTLQLLAKLSAKQIKSFSDLEKVSLEQLCNWSKLREQTLHCKKISDPIEEGHLNRKLKSEQIQKRSESRKNTCTVTNGIVTKYVPLQDLQKYLDEGWVRGISEYRKQRLSESHMNIPGSSLGRVCIYKDGKERKILPEQLPEFLKEGWSRGRSDSFKEKRKEYLSIQQQKGLRVRVRKNNIGKIIPKEQLQDYINAGWELGMVKK